MATPYAIHHLDEVATTQDEARSRFTGGDPVVVLAARQLQGRGRTGNAWVHAPRATAASVAVHPGWPAEALGLIPLVAGMAARDAVADAARIEPTLKWPNDVMFGDAKIGGVLVEAADGVIVAGCGINLWWPSPPPGVAAVFGDDPGRERTFEIAEAWAAELLDRLAAGPESWGRAAYAAVCSTLGHDIEWDPAGRGRAVEIAPDGGLVVETAIGRETLRSGEVRMIRAATLRSTQRIDRGAESS